MNLMKFWAFIPKCSFMKKLCSTRPFLFNIQFQRRVVVAKKQSKYHSGGLWTNTCCTHPYPEEDVKFAAERRLIEEMGMRVKLEKSFDFYIQ